MDVGVSRVRPEDLAGLLDKIDEGVLSTSLAKQVFEEMFRTGSGAAEVIESKGLMQISGEGEIEPIVEQVIGENPGVVAEYRGGKEKALQFLVGQVMKITKGRAKPELVNKLLREKLR